MPWSQFNSSAKTQTPPLLYAEGRAKTVSQQIHYRFVRLKTYTFRLRNRPCIPGVCVLATVHTELNNCLKRARRISLFKRNSLSEFLMPKKVFKRRSKDFFIYIL